MRMAGRWAGSKKQTTERRPYGQGSFSKLEFAGASNGHKDLRRKWRPSRQVATFDKATRYSMLGITSGAQSGASSGGGIEISGGEVVYARAINQEATGDEIAR
ncbi:hypothetical protein KM043_017409 [Ampulex compressa]|nr:hypothetical protein KM043_017409 [Ampulex compressa]